MDKKIEIRTIRIGVAGYPAEGKASICNTYTLGETFLNNISLIDSEKYEKKLQIKNGNFIKLIIWFIYRQERIRSAYLKPLENLPGTILAFDVTNKQSFENIQSWLQLFEEIGKKNYALFWNKIDKPKD